ncbi:Streptogrisin-D [Streptantibioticus cattleyicolor NRRL 8057 = DSM 46488]|nr:Streptogrisin-D [Streptantibioticus cattleyicolor NRRL 8057 = DSM 46488]
MLAVAAVALPAALLPAAHPARGAAPPEPTPVTQAAALKIASDLTARLGDRAAGVYYDATARQLVVNITDPANADTVRAAGAVPRTVKFTTAQLHQATVTLGEQARIPGTAWAVDPRRNKVVITADPTVTGARRTQLDQAVAQLGEKAVLRQGKAVFRPFIAGGDAIYGGVYRCSLGFNVTKGGASYFLTAGHCGNVAASWSDAQAGQPFATTVDSRFPGTDFALVKYDDPQSTAHPSTVDLYGGGTQQITQAAEATVGERVRRSGSTSQVHEGQVTGLDATVNYQEGTVTGLIDTNVCAEPGDSGGSLFDGASAIGLTSGGSGDCTAGGETFYQPVPAALRAEGAQLP